MEKKELKRQRTRLVFAETARAMIHENGVESVSVRKIAERAGYSLGTVYNHFKNLDEMLWLTRDLLIKEIALSLADHQEPMEKPDDLAQSYKKYIEYYLDHPHVFRFFYFHQLDIKDRIESDYKAQGEVDIAMINTCRFIEETGGHSARNSLTIYKTIIYAVHGMLMLSIAGNDGIDKEQLSSEIDSLVKLFFEAKEEK